MAMVTCRECEGRLARYAVLVVGAVPVLVALVATAAAERIEVPCGEWARVTGQDVCDMAPAVKVERSRWEAKKRAAARGSEERPVVELWNGPDGGDAQCVERKRADGQTEKVCTKPDGSTEVPKPVIDLWE